jgi:probable F420-dependent oxidoreductase
MDPAYTIVVAASMARFGIGLPGVQQIPSRAAAWERSVGGAEMLAAARAAEAAGFDWVACSDHVLVPASRAEAMGPTWYDAGSTLAFVAGGTRTIRLLSHVLVLPYRHPLVVAKQYGTLDHLAGGRLVLGIGSGHLKPEFKVLGADYERRGKVTDEYLAAILAAWASPVAAFAGETVAFRDVMVSPGAVQRPHPPIWVGGNSRAALRRAARLGDGWIPWELSPAELAAAVEQARALRAQAGRPAEFEVVAPLGIPADADAGRVASAAAALRGAGATAFHVGILGARTFQEHLDRLAWVGADVMPRLERES